MINNNLVEVKNNTVVVSSLQIARHFEKEHRSVLKSIKDLLLNIEGLHNFMHTPEMFQKSTYIHEQNKKECPMYLMNRDGFSLLVMGFTGKEALEWKIKYIKAFNAMEQEIKDNQHQLNVDLKMKLANTSAELETYKDYFHSAFEDLELQTELRQQKEAEALKLHAFKDLIFAEGMKKNKLTYNNILRINNRIFSE